MKIIVLGAGVVGTTSAWYLAKAGHSVTVIDRQSGAGMETSFANGGQISASFAEPWSNPSAPLKLAKWLLRDDAPLLFRWRMDPNQWRWGLTFLFECLPSRYRFNVRNLSNLALASRSDLRALRAETNIQYDQLERGILYYFTEPADYEAAKHSGEIMRQFGVDRHIISVDEAVAIEPAIKPFASRLIGADYTADDESGDAFRFTQELAKLAREHGATFCFDTTILSLERDGARVSGVRVRDANGERVEHADAVLVCLGSFSPMLVKPLGLYLPIYPAKGYSATFEVTDAAAAPTVSLTDNHYKIVFSRLGNRLRVAGTAELSGYSTELNQVRCEALTRRTRELFGHAVAVDRPQYWAGLRPATPSNLPLIGATRVPGLYLNCGHGTLGWTLGCASGKAIAEIMSGRKPDVEFAFLDGSR